MDSAWALGGGQLTGLGGQQQFLVGERVPEEEGQPCCDLVVGEQALAGPLRVGFADLDPVEEVRGLKDCGDGIDGAGLEAVAVAGYGQARRPRSSMKYSAHSMSLGPEGVQPNRSGFSMACSATR